jgi:YD repeat-containing protein
VTYTYNTLGLVATKTDAKGQELKYVYDAYGRLSTVSLAGSPDTLLRTYAYDTNSVNKNYSQYAWGRLTTVTYNVPAIESTWDPNLNGGNGGTVNFTGDTVVEMYSYTQPGQVAGKQLLITRQNSRNEVLQANLSGSWGYNNEGTMVRAVYPGAPVRRQLEIRPDDN